MSEVPVTIMFMAYGDVLEYKGARMIFVFSMHIQYSIRIVCVLWRISVSA